MSCFRSARKDSIYEPLNEQLEKLSAKNDANTRLREAASRFHMHTCSVNDECTTEASTTSSRAQNYNNVPIKR
jgi:hypothetical protein